MQHFVQIAWLLAQWVGVLSQYLYIEMMSACKCFATSAYCICTASFLQSFLVLLQSNCMRILECKEWGHVFPRGFSNAKQEFMLINMAFDIYCPISPVHVKTNQSYFHHQTLMCDSHVADLFGKVSAKTQRWKTFLCIKTRDYTPVNEAFIKWTSLHKFPSAL